MPDSTAKVFAENWGWYVATVVPVLWWMTVNIKNRIKLSFSDPIVRVSALDIRCKQAGEKLEEHEHREDERYDELREEQRKAHERIYTKIDRIYEHLLGNNGG